MEPVGATNEPVGSDTRSAVNGISLQEPDLRNTMDDTTIAAVAVLAMISVQLLYAAGNRKLAEMRQRHEKDLSRVHGQLQFAKVAAKPA